MDLTDTIAPKSDQLNAYDLIAGSITVTISDVPASNAEQPVDVHLLEFPGRAYRPSKSISRVLVAAWGADGKAYTGYRLPLYRNPKIAFGRDKVGGIEISHMTGLSTLMTIALTATCGKRKGFTVTPLLAGRDWTADLQQATSNREAVSALGAAAQAVRATALTIALIRAEFDRLARR